MRVLIVDDEASVRLAIERRLRAANMGTVQASNVKQAMDRLRAEPFDVVLCDLRMPGGDGSDLVTWLSSYSPSTRIVVMSAYVTDEFRSTFGSATGLTIMEKPLDLGDLVATLEQFGPRRGFYGNAIELELFDYVQMIALSGRDKLVEVQTPQALGRIWFEHGDIVHVEYRDLRGEMAFYKLLASGRGTFKEVFNSPPPKVTVLRSSTHLLMEAARLADEGLLVDDTEPIGETKTQAKEPDETSFEDLNSEIGPAASETEGVAANAAAGVSQDATEAAAPDAEILTPTPVPEVPVIEDPDDLFAPPEPAATVASAPLEVEDDRTPEKVEDDREPEKVEADREPEKVEDDRKPEKVEGDREPEKVEGDRKPERRSERIKDEVSFDESDLAVLDALTEMGEDESTEEFVAETHGSTPPAAAAPPEAVAPANEENPVAATATPAAAQEPPAKNEPAAASAGGLSHAIFDDPDMRNVMLEQFWQFEGVNGVAIISSTGKVLAEDMRSNSSLVTLAGFYMRGAARIARTLGHNVFDGVVARSVNGQQMVMVSMGAASAVLSVEPGIDPEVVRDAVMGVE